jgi:pimeloyl-ACP methyl ester carboxylesterase
VDVKVFSPRRPDPCASCGPEGPRQRKVDPVFRVERCAVQEREHRMDPKSGDHFWVRCSSGWRLPLVLTLASVLAPLPLRSEPFATGKSEREVKAGEVTWNVQAYKAECYRDGLLVLVFHGSDRNPPLARDNAVPLAQAGCALVIVPLFDEARFPRWSYQFGGLGELVDENGRRRFRLKPKDRQTGELVLDLIEALRLEEGRPNMPYSLIGHSAGAQFLSRFAAFFPNEARRIVLANPGSYVVPTWERKYPYGFGGLTVVDEADRKRYLGSPITILLASRDIDREGLDTSPGAERQGSTRYERGHATYRLAEASAAADNATFGWSLVEVTGLGHGSRKLYARPEAASALFGPDHSRSAGTARSSGGSEKPQADGTTDPSGS